MKIKVSELETLTKAAIKSYGYADSEVSIISKVILYAQLRGNNQGIVKLIGRGIPKSKDAGEITIIKETSTSALLDGSSNFGMVVMDKVVSMVLEKVKEHGFAIVGTRGTASSTGAIGYYAHKIAQAGFINHVYAGSPETVSHHGSIEPKYGTNPLAIGVPGGTEPVVLDMATAAISWFGLVEAKTAGQKIPSDVAIDSDGQPTDDPAKAMEGAILPFDRSYKGANLAMMVEIFTGPLVGSTFVGIGDGSWGNLIYAFDPGLLIDASEFKENISQLVTNIKSSTKAKGIEEIFVAGERGNKLAQQRISNNEIEIEDNLLSELKKVANSSS